MYHRLGGNMIVVAILVLAACTQQAGEEASVPAADVAAASPAVGYDIHVTAPHMVNGVVMGPFHHYCKVISPEPVIQCILFETTQPDAPMTEVEYIVAKSITRQQIDREQWNRAWHDHAVEIASGRVKVHDLPEEEAQKIVEIVRTTDGLIFHMWPVGSEIPTGDVVIAQAISHVPLSEEEWGSQRNELVATTKSD